VKTYIGVAMNERIQLAAIWYKEIPIRKECPHVLPVNCDRGLVVTGFRHGHCIWTVLSLTGLRSVQFALDGTGESEQGFITNKNRFVGREEALEIALREGQVLDLKQIRGNKLYSEDLY